MTTTATKKLYRLKNSNESYEVNNNLLDEFKNMKSRNGSELSPYSCNSYASKVNRISILMTNKPYEDYKYFVCNADNIIKKVNDSDFKSKKDYFSAINKLLTAKNVNVNILDKYKAAMKTQKQNEDIQRGENMATNNNVKKSNNAGTLKEIQNKIKNYSIMDNNKIDDTKLVNKLLTSFYFMNPNFIPRNDLPEMKLVSKTKAKGKLSDEFNYIVIDGVERKPMKIIMKNYKTKSTYGTQSFNISPFLTEILQTYLKEYNKLPGDYLFVDRNNKPFKHKNFSNLLENAMENILGSKIGVDLARQILLSNMYNDKLMSINDKKELARAFLHSPTIAEEYIRINLIENNNNMKK